MVGHLANVTVYEVPTNDCWIRDFGPTFVTRKDDQTLVGVDWKYNAWGERYPPYSSDAAATETICRILGCPRNVSSIYCEGGALDTDGQGTLLTTRSCLLNANRNPSWPQDWIETELQRQLGIQKILWVDGGALAGDDTDGHIDQLARFVAPGVVVAAVSGTHDDPNRAGLADNARILSQARDSAGRTLDVHQLPTPPPRFVDGVRIPESYCNFVLANGIVVVPTFRSNTTDQAAIDLLGQLFPERSILPLDAHDLVWGLGAFHCASQHQPEASALKLRPAL